MIRMALEFKEGFGNKVATINCYGNKVNSDFKGQITKICNLLRENELEFTHVKRLSRTLCIYRHILFHNIFLYYFYLSILLRCHNEWAFSSVINE